MTEPAVHPTLTHEQWLQVAEGQYAPFLRQASLVVEVDFHAQHATKAAKALGARYKQGLGLLSDPAVMLHKYPATLAIAMVGVGAVDYGEGTYWPRFFQAAGLENGPENQHVFGQAFLRALDRFGLPRFGHLKLRYLSPILMHGGIPNAALGDFLELLIERRALDPGLDGVSFMAWALDPTGPNRLAHLDVPARNFIRDGGEFALDIVERTLEVLDYLKENGDQKSIEALATDTTGLPRLMIDELKELVVGGLVALTRLPGRVEAAKARRENPSLTLDWVQGTVQVELPPARTSHGRIVWTVAADGDVRTVESQAQWVGDNQETPATSCAVGRPARRIQVTNGESGRQTDHSLVNPADPLILFNDDGQLLEPGLPVPAGSIWALRPMNDSNLVDQEGAPVSVLLEDVAPAGWHGWGLANVDTTKIRGIRLVIGSALGALRQVRQDELPVIRLPEPIRGLFTPQGLPVYGATPSVLLPNDSQGKVTWTVSVHRIGDVAPISSIEVTTQDGREIDPFAWTTGALLGTIQLVVRGPLGRNATRTFSVAAGVESDFTPPVRRLRGRELEPASAEIKSNSDVSLSSSSLAFDGQTIQQMISCSVGRVTTTVMVKPPHMEILIDAPGVPATWITHIGRLTPEAVVDARSMLVRIPETKQPVRLQFRGESTHLTQTIEPAARQSSAAYRFNLFSFADSARQAVRAELFAQIGESYVLIATIRPRTHASGAAFGSTGLVLTDYIKADSIKAAVYAQTAPWLGPMVCDVSDAGVIGIPTEFGDSGSLVVYLAEDDGWGAVEWPRWPVEDALSVHRPGYRHSDDSAEQQLSRLLGQVQDGEAMTEGHLILDKLWSTLSVLPYLMAGGVARDHIESQIRAALTAERGRALPALMTAAVPPVAVPELLIRSGLAEQRIPPMLDQDVLHSMWSRFPEIAALPAIATWTEPPTWTEPGAGVVRDELKGDMDLFVGVCLGEILNAQADPYRETPKFDKGAQQMAKMKVANLDMLWHASQVVPDGILQGDSRMVAARELFDVRGKVALKPLLTSLPSIMKSVVRDVASCKIPAVRQQLEARADADLNEGWQYLPMLSFSFAARARLAARRPAEHGPLPRHDRRLWRVLATLAPNFVMMDLLLADALIAGSQPAVTEGENS